MVTSRMWYNIAIVGWGAKEGKKYYKVIISLLAMKVACIANIKTQQHFLE